MPELERSHSRWWLEALDHPRSWITARRRLLRLGKAIVLGALLLAPSVWMLSVIPPLWRDLDAYIQLTEPPGILTIVHFGPLYCFGARIPLYIGYIIECLGAGKSFPSPSFFIYPTLNDSGVFLLLLSQHSALFCSAFYFIILSSRLFWVRLVLAAVWASNPLFYTFAHCVGSETLSMILLLLVGAVGLRIVQRPGNVGWKRWGLLGVLLWLSILTRHINAVLATILPLTFVFLCGYRLFTIPLSRSQLLGRWRRLRMRQELKEAAVAVAIGISAIALANVSLRGLCGLVRMPYYSTFGTTVMSRLDFLARLPSEERNQLLDEIARNSPFVDVKKAVPLLRESFSREADNWDVIQSNLIKKNAEKVIPLHREAFPQGSAGADDSIAFLKRATLVFPGVSLLVMLNRTAEAFLLPPRKVFLDAVAVDFRRSQLTTIQNMVNQLFLTTTLYFFFASDRMPAYAPLLTYRHRSPNEIIGILEKHRYFHLWRRVNYAAFLCFWAANLMLLVVLAQMRERDVAAVASYAVALTLVGVLMMLANCFLIAFLPRFALPMWELTILSVTVLLGLTLDLPNRRKAKICSCATGENRRVY
jgi:hypothetical protein